MDGNIIFFLLPFCLLLIGTKCQKTASIPEYQDARRFPRQYGQYNSGTDDTDLVTGALLATCTFYGDNTVDCNGRLRCHPRDVEDRITSATLDRVCPRELSQKSGTWDRDQVIPSSIIRGTGSGRLAQCKFYANNQQGKFTCTGAQGDTWKGEYTGTINTAFKLGLPLQSGYGSSSYENNNPDPYSSRGRVGDDDYYSSRTTTPSYRGRVGDDDYYGRRTTIPPYGSGYGNRDDYSGGRYSTGLGYNDRDPNYRDNAAIGRDRYDSNYRGSGAYDRDNQNPAGSSESEITMCTYTTDGAGVCRDCTERVDRRETDREIRTTRHYTCRGVETPASWSASSGIIPDKVPNPYVLKRHVATCIFRANPKTFECHGGSSDGGCSLSNDGYGSSGSSSYGSGLGSSAQKCLSGEKWSGTYRGSIYSN